MAAVKVEAPVLTQQKYGQIVLTLDNVLLPKEKLNPSPSDSDGLDAETEYDLRVLGCELIQTSGILLRLPQVAMACGQVLFQRFYYAKSLVRYSMETTAMACVALASKIEEAPRKIRDVISVFRHIRQVRNGKTLTPVVLDANYTTLKNQVIKAERRLLKELGFCCHVKHPHKMIIMYLRLVEADNNRSLAKSSWNYMNDALRTDVFMRYTPESIACSCIWLAARQLRVPLPENPPWYHMVSVQLDDIQFIAASILKLYTRPKVKLETLEAKVEEIRKQQQEARLRNRLLPAGGSLQQTPLQPITSTFSPSSRNHTPHVPREQSRPGQHPAKRRDRDGHNRSGSDTSTTTVGSRRSRSGVSPNRSHKKPRRSDSRDGSRSRSHSNDRHHSRGRSRSRERSRDRSRDRHTRKSPSKSSSPNVTPPPRFIKNKEKGPIVQSVSRSRSRSPVRAYSKYERQDVKYGKYERKDKHISADKYTSSDKYGDKYGGNDKYDAGYERSDKSSEKYKFDKYDKLDKYERNDKYVDKYSNDKIVKYEEKYEKVEVYSKHDRFGREEKFEIGAKYVMDGKEKSNKYEKYDKVDKYERYPKYEKSEKKKAHESKKNFDNGFEKYEKVHKNKKASRHRSRSRDHRR